ncbi:MAG: hypothetical protein CMH61_02460 [Nanoarchaeota archaeon]|mgnify:CR=1 FL=1|nr:hypothetical protein [Nanoarchaeota archaeon]|tara:strand:+ start:2211 stop:2786 length:576 start_codon:yes stop_codon:yes gene_type:complete
MRFKNKELQFAYEKSVWYCKKYGNKSNGHTINHTHRVMLNALWLQRKLKLQCNTKLLIISTLLHDISRSYGYCGDIHGFMSYKLVEDFLMNQLQLSNEELEIVKQAITKHCIDDKTVHQSIEEKVMYDADKLDGFGLRGMYRIFVYHYIERRNGVRFVLNKMNHGMNKRRNNLHFNISKKKSKFLNIHWRK